MSLLKRIKKKKFPVRTFSCPIYEQEFYFKNKHLIDSKALTSIADIHGGEDAIETMVAIYLYMSCDENGKREYPDVDDKAIPDVVKELLETDGFDEHLEDAFKFAWNGKIMKDSDLVSDKEGSVDQAKKPS